MYVALILQDFDFEPLNFPLPVSVMKGKLIGFLPVYATKEDALSEFPNREVLEIRKVKNGNYNKGKNPKGHRDIIG